MRSKPGHLVTCLAFASLLALGACGPADRRSGIGGGSGSVDAAGACTPPGGPENSAATCSDGIDNDCDGLIDCVDPDCSGIGQCPVCGMVQHPLSTPLALPDGVDGGTACTMSSTCAAPTPSCVASECHGSYNSTLHFDGFGATQTFADASNIQSVCVTIEHSWLRDLEIVLQGPDGKQVELQKMEGRDCPATGPCEIYLGQANDCDSDASPVPGVGAEYCFKPTATKPAMLAYADGNGTMSQVTGCDGASHDEMPPGDYSAAGQWTDLVGTPLNGDWQLVVTDAWAIDNGYIFQWSIAFDPSLVQTCSTPPIQ